MKTQKPHAMFDCLYIEDKTNGIPDSDRINGEYVPETSDDSEHCRN